MDDEKRKKMILLVEDNEGDVLLAKEAVLHNNSDIELIHVNNGDEAFEYLFNRNNIMPDLIILDLNLPGMNGIEILQILKNEPKTQRIPVTIFSMSSNESDISRCYNLKANSFITKPIDLDEFFEVFKGIDEFMKNNLNQR